MKLSKITNISIKKAGLISSLFDVDNNTIAIALPYNEEYLNKYIEIYQNHLKTQGITTKFQKKIYYKRSFWKFWEMRSCIIAVFKIQNKDFQPDNKLNYKCERFKNALTGGAFLKT